MTKPDLVKMLTEQGHLPGLVGKVKAHELTEARFKEMIYSIVAHNYRQAHPDISERMAQHYAVLNFQEVGKLMWQSYQAGHHQLIEYKRALRGVPHG